VQRWEFVVYLLMLASTVAARASPNVAVIFGRRSVEAAAGRAFRSVFCDEQRLFDAFSLAGVALRHQREI
jgi:hypothetical protein